ncbi:MAG: SprT-like domain-containing protein [Methanotrichaceae archaeon]|nr:SprT-like domain-containing protein [Methanotrichaceae archaeon]
MFEGQCDGKGKRILVRSLDVDGVIIHEICHAVTSEWHNKKWLARMEKAALKAESIGEEKLAKGIRERLVSSLGCSPSLNHKTAATYSGVGRRFRRSRMAIFPCHKPL